MQQELEALDAALGHPMRPVCAVVGGSKVSTKLELLGNLVGKVDMLVIGGAMANTFLAAQGAEVGRSLQEADMHETARDILRRASLAGCEIVLPTDAVIAREFRAHAPTELVSAHAIPADAMMLDVGPETVDRAGRQVIRPQDAGLERPPGCLRDPAFRRRQRRRWRMRSAMRRNAGALRSVAGGGDTVSALKNAGEVDRLTYVSSAGGAFPRVARGQNPARSRCTPEPDGTFSSASTLEKMKVEEVMQKSTAAVVASVAAVGALLSGSRFNPSPAHPGTAAWYARLDKPDFTPPGPIFGSRVDDVGRFARLYRLSAY